MPGTGVFSIGVKSVFGRGKGSNFMRIPRIRASPRNGGAGGFRLYFFCKIFVTDSLTGHFPKSVMAPEG